MKILNIGSLNIDDVYQVDHFVQPGETLNSISYYMYCGGKGLNQSIAIARAGGNVFHAGKIGADGKILKDKLNDSGVNTELVFTAEEPSGRAIIQVNCDGENAILLNKGANKTFTVDEIRHILKDFTKGDMLLLQNEINKLREIILEASSRGMIIALNPAPMEPEIMDLPLEKVGIFIVNEIEGEGLTGEKEPDKILASIRKMFPEADVFLTLGSRGVMFLTEKEPCFIPAKKVTAVDTTGAGDTFIGYLLSGLSRGKGNENAVKTAVSASAICVTRNGASDSIPFLDEL